MIEEKSFEGPVVLSGTEKLMEDHYEDRWQKMNEEERKEDVLKNMTQYFHFKAYDEIGLGNFDWESVPDNKIENQFDYEYRKIKQYLHRHYGPRCIRTECLTDIPIDLTLSNQTIEYIMKDFLIEKMLFKHELLEGREYLRSKGIACAPEK